MVALARIELATFQLSAECSTTELQGIKFLICSVQVFEFYHYHMRL